MEIVELSWGREQQLANFFLDIEADPECVYFRPHVFDASTVLQLITLEEWEAYVVASPRKILAYGLLRGWPPEYEMPRLGIAVHPLERGRGIGAAMMAFLHSRARMRGMPGVELKVHAENHVARGMYIGLGYDFVRQDGHSGIYRLEFK